MEKEEKEEQVLGEVKMVEEEQEGNMEDKVGEEKEDQRNAPSPPLPSLNEVDHRVEQVGELVASPPPAPSLPSPHAEAMELEEQRQAGDDGVTTVVEKYCGFDVVDKETGGAGGTSLQQQEMVAVEKKDGRDVEQQLPAKVPSLPWPPSALQELLVGLRALIARLDPSGMWWFGVWGDGGKHGEEENKGERDWELQGIGTRVILSTFVSWGAESMGRRLTKPRRETERERFKVTRHLPDKAYSQRARISLFSDFI